MTRPRGQGGLRHISDILTDITQADEPPPPRSIEPHPYNPDCPCGDCMRAYLRSVDAPKGDAA